MNPAAVLPAGHMTADAYHPGPPAAVSSYPNAPVGRAWQDDITQTQYAVAGHYQPHTTHENTHDTKGLLSYPGSIPAFGKF